MKKNKVFISLLLLPLFGKAQLVSPKIIDKYSPGIVSKIYETTLTTFISYETQIKLANLLTLRDSLVLKAIKDNKDLKIVKNIIDSFQLKFENQFQTDEKIRYMFNKHKDYIEADAKLNATYIKQKYSINPGLEKTFNSLLKSKNQETIKMMGSNSNLLQIPDSIFRTLSVYDTIYTGNIIAAQGQEYYNNALKRINEIKPIPEKDVNKLEEAYRLQCYRRGNNYSNNFNTAMKSVIRDSIYYKILFQDSIKNLASKRALLEVNEYMYRYNLQRQEVNKITPIIENKVQKTIWLETIYPFNRLRDSLQTYESDIAWLKVKKELLKLGYVALAKSRIGGALQHKKSLKLSGTQVDSLINYNFEIDTLTLTYKMNNYGESPDYSDYERLLLRRCLREPQYDTLIIYESLVKAKAIAKTDWFDILNAKLATLNDSASIIPAITDYHLKRLILTERYYTDPEAYDNYLKAAINNKPEILKKLYEKNEEMNIEKKKLNIKW